MSKEEAVACLENTAQFDPDIERQKINRGYNENIASFIIKSQEAYLNMKPETYNKIKTNIIDKWDEIQEIALEVPSSNELKLLLKNIGGATEPTDLGLTNIDIRNAIDYAQYVRKAFNILNVNQMLGYQLMNESFLGS